MPTRDLDRICEIAARLHEDGERLRQLGLDHAARLLAAAEAALDARVYATGGRQDILFGEMVFGRPARLRRVKGREASSH